MRTYDLVLFGATGFTGRLTAEYLRQARGGTALRWAIAGRNRDKLEAVKRELGLDAAIVVCDTSDEARVAAVARDARVIATTVGPFLEHGRKLVAACAANGTHYADITGEVDFMRASIDDNDAPAKESRARVVHACGFDSLPFDLGVYMLWDHVRAPLAWAKSFVRMKGGFSGGTAATMMKTMAAVRKDRALRRLLANPYALDPDPNRGGGPSGRARGDVSDAPRVRFDEDLGGWTAPFVMAAVNTRVVRRSNALLDFAYGERFRYAEAMSFPKGPKGLARASALMAGLAAFAGGAAFAPTRRVLETRVLPKPGDGPSQEEREAGFFEVRVLARTEDGRRVSGRVAGARDPGYGETARMLGESALCLAEDASKLPDRFGVLTPATAMGMTVAERLRTSPAGAGRGMTFALD
jgi:short subunit dehydrogenase-like uncharacterized protein